MIGLFFHQTERMQNQLKTYCIIGDPIRYSLSPAMQNAAFNSAGLNCTYIAFRVPKGELEESIFSLRSANLAGFNVTIPHKVEVIKYLDDLDCTAKKANAVNTVHNSKGIFKGYNTDVYGFIEPLHKRNVVFNGMTILLLGAGGAAHAVIAALSDEQGISKIIIANRSQKKAQELADIGFTLGLQCETATMDNIKGLAISSNLIVNTIPIGMNNEESILDYKHISKDSIVYDIVYKPITTPLLENAKYAEAQIVYGYEMLLEQGAKAFEIWTAISAPRDAMKKALFGSFGEPI
jgi:shikimate dehydrogenase